MVLVALQIWGEQVSPTWQWQFLAAHSKISRSITLQLVLLTHQCSHALFWNDSKQTQTFLISSKLLFAVSGDSCSRIRSSRSHFRNRSCSRWYFRWMPFVFCAAILHEDSTHLFCSKCAIGSWSLRGKMPRSWAEDCQNCRNFTFLRQVDSLKHTSRFFSRYLHYKYVWAWRKCILMEGN